jgi:hypothetical protein
MREHAQRECRAALLCSRYRLVLINTQSVCFKQDSAVSNRTLLWLFGVPTGGEYEVLGAWLKEPRTAATWRQVLEGLKERGVEQLDFVLSSDVSVESELYVAFPMATLLERSPLTSVAAYSGCRSLSLRPSLSTQAMGVARRLREDLDTAFRRHSNHDEDAALSFAVQKLQLTLKRCDVSSRAYPGDTRCDLKKTSVADFDSRTIPV